MDTVYTVDQIRRAEQSLLDSETTPDELMRSAASGVAAAARVMLQRPPIVPPHRKVLLAVGAGGNGGDALYAGTELLAEGWEVDAVLFGVDRSTGETRVHERALTAFTDAGGAVVELDQVWPRPPAYRLLIDGILGMGGAGGVGPAPAVLFTFAADWFIPVLSVDVPSGIDADTGAVPAVLDLDDADQPVDPDAGTRWPEGMKVLETDRVAAHAVADVTVTFGGLRRAHAVNAWCGQVVVADPALADGRSISGELDNVWMADLRRKKGTTQGRGMRVSTSLAYVPRRAEKPFGGVNESGPYDFAGTDLTPLRVSGFDRSYQPGPYDDKYSGGVVGICAGSDAYPGAGILATTAAVRTTSSMVRYVADGGTHGVAADVVRACPEVVASPTVAETGRVQAWVVGPGRGTGDDAAAELETLLQRPEPLLVDADAITLLADHGHLRDLLVARSDGDLYDPSTLLTPHAGEFRRLAAAVRETGAASGSDVQIPDPDTDRIGAAVAMAEALHCGVLLKGRHTVIVDRPLTYRRGGDGRLADIKVHTVDAGTSWGATPGSGDVLSGIAGALLAESQAMLGSADHAAPGAVVLHGVASGLAAQVGGEESDRYVPTSASAIAETVPRALASAGRAISSRRRRL